jgi:photosystem II stability/assembly factor-like uncharacterized protein
MSQITNPYFAGPPASDPKTFFGRQDVLRFVDETLASPMHNEIVFYGQRRIGKTSILHQIAHRSGRDYQAALFDLQSSLDSPAHGLFYGLAREVAGQLNLPAPDRADFEHDPDTFRTRFLPQVYNHLGDRRLLLLLDEFDALSPETTPAELDALPFVKALNRMIQSDDKQVVFLFVVGRRLKDLSSQQLQIFRGGRDRQIGLLKKEATLQLITRPAEGILTYQDAAVERIWMLTSGHPYFTQLLCQEIFNQAQRQRVRIVVESHVEAVIDEAINTGQSALQWFWDEVPPIERFTLYTIGQLETERTGVTLDQLIDRRDAQRAQIDELELRALPDQLVDRQVLKRDSAQCYHFAVELVRHWIVQGHSLEEVTTELTRAAVDELAKALFETGRAAYRADDTSFAIDNFSRALSINSNYVEARLWLARAYAKAGDLLAAINEFVNVERFGGPQQREARIGLADARSQYGQQLEQEGKIEQARQEYQRTLELDPQHALANVRLSGILRQQADERLENEGVVAAQPFYEQALKRNPSTDLEREIKERLKQYSQAQEEVNNWEEAGLARHLSAQLTSSPSDEQEALLRFHLRQGHWHLSQNELETAAEVYRRVLEETAGDASRQTIENDILRYSQQQEESNNWSQAEAALTLLIELFPEDLENRRQLADSLCRQAEFYLDQDDLSRAKIAYQCALADDPTNQALRNLIRAGFQSYRRARAKQNKVQDRKSVEEAMLVLVEILGQEDILACQWLSEARTDLGDALRAEGRLAEAQAVYRQALEDAIHMLQLAAETDQAYHFDEAAKRIGQALAGAAPDQEMADRIKTIFNNYRHRQEEKLRWSHARRAMEELEHLFPEDEDTRFWLAETQAAETNWHLQRAIPDLDEARRLARSALDVPLSQPKADLIIDQIKKAFQTHCLQQEEANPPNWRQAEQTMNKLVSLFPGDPAVNRWLADTRLRQGDWHLTQENQSPVEAGRHLTEAAEVYKRALRELPNDDSLITHLKRSFKDYRGRRERSDPSARSLARQAMQILAELLPNDTEVRQWLAEIEKPVPPPRRELLRKWGPVIVGATIVVVMLCLGSFFFRPGGPDSLIAFLRTSTPTATATPPATPSPTTPPTTPFVTVPPTTLPPTTPPTTVPTTTPTPSESCPPPQLVSPSHGTSLTGTSSLPELSWRSTCQLGPHDYYLVELQFLENGHLTTYRERLRSTAWKVPIEIFHRVDLPEQRIQWRVVVAQIPDDDVENAIELSPFSETWAFTWRPIPQPQLVSPPDGTSIEGIGSPPKLEWDPIEELGPDGYYLVELQFLEDSQPSLYKERLKEPIWEVPVEVFYRANPPRQIQWRVVTAQVQGAEPEFSEPSETWTFTWKPNPPLRLVRPPQAASFQGASPPPRLEWGPVGELGPDDYYLVRLNFLKGGQIYTYTWELRDTIWEVPTEVFHLADPPEREIEWQVVTVNISSEDDVIELSDPSKPRTFTWEPILLPDGEALDVVINPENSLQVLVVLRGIGIYKSDNGGIDWRLVSNERTIETLHSAPAKTGVVYAGAFAQVLKSEDQGETWRASSIPPYAQVYAITTDPDDANIVFVATDRGIMRSGDGGQTWLTLDRAGTDGEQVLDSRFYSVAAGTSQGNRVYAAGEGDQIFWRGTDDTGTPWKIQVCNKCAPPIFALAVERETSDKLLAGSNEGRLAISSNAGAGWSQTTIPPSIPTLKFSVLAFDPTNPQIVYAGSGSHRNPTDGEGLYRSLDGGLTWHRFNAWVPSGNGRGTYVQGIALTPTDSQVILIAGSEGVFRSDDGGISWTKQ